MPSSIEPAARVGDPAGAIDTPALVIDADAMDRNIAAMAGFAREHGLKLRPHAKTHKCAALARRQMEAGAVGVCVQKVGEALALAAGGVSDLYLSNEVIAPHKLARLAALARQVKLSIAVDSLQGIEHLALALRAHPATIDVFVEIDVGQGRCGAAPGQAALLARAVQAQAASGLRLAGLQAYHGGAQHVRGTAARQAAITQAAESVRTALAALRDAGIACPLVTGAGSGSFVFEAASGLWGELQAGSYLFMDRDYADNEPAQGAPRFEHALFIKSSVISRGAAHAVVDAGHKSHAVDSGLPRVWGRELDFANGGDEHGIVRARPGEILPELGDTVWLVPGHCDPTVNLHDHYVLVRGGLEAGRVAEVLTIDARGAIR
ncbi:MAG TPA: DSD1 family PLP-dependent enzyme [Burkholderiaceae bacterium]|nr:DSD1 family PLP-dependent enzyme [Burkholderiaceae bacterium]